MHLTRTILFGATHLLDSSPAEFKRTMGYDYKLDITVKGNLNPKTGIVVNIVHIDKIIKTVLQNVDGKLLDELEFFKENQPTLENLLIYFWNELEGLFVDAELDKLKLQQTPFLYGEIRGNEKMNVYVTKLFHFSSAHRLHSYYLNQDDNIELFGKCNNLYGHGHNYKLEVTVKGRPDPNTGAAIHYKRFEDIVEERVVNLFDHKHINADIEMFENKNPTSEMLLYVIWDLLKDEIPSLYKIGIWETEKNYFEYYGHDHV